MKTRGSFVFSVLLHALIVAAVVASVPTEETEEEIILELALMPAVPPGPTEPIPQTDAPKPPEVQPPVEKRLTPLSKAPAIEKDEPEPVVAKAVASPSEPVRPVQTPQPEPVAIPVSKPVPAVPAVDAEKEYLDDHLSTIRELLVKYRKYPSQAVRLRQEGSVKISFRLKHDGEVDEIRVVEGSGFPILDEDAIALIRKTAEYFPKPPKAVRITVPLNYGLKTRPV